MQFMLFWLKTEVDMSFVLQKNNNINAQNST